MRVLFICKRNDTYGFQTYSRRSSGLYNSTRFIVEGLAKRGVHAAIVEVKDNNEIDREVTEFKPHLVIIEALWVVPEKFDVLKKLHPGVKWFVHLHSQIPFLAQEGISMRWIHQYQERKIGIIANSAESFEALQILTHRKIEFLQNVYISRFRETPFNDKPWLNIGCFGAIRPFKNHLTQAIAAIEFSKHKGKPLQFYVNSSRVETGGEPVLKNLIQLFEDQEYAELVCVKWNEPEEFLDLLQTMDLGMQVSMTETFNVVTADYITAGISVVVSPEVKWASGFSKADPHSVKSILKRMHTAWRNRSLIDWNQHLLRKYSVQAQNSWFEFCHREITLRGHE